MIGYITNYRFNKYQNLALQKLGRNLHNFSLAERCLKHIVTLSEIAVIGSTSEPILHGKTKRNVEKAKKMMLGQLIHEVLHLWNPEAIVHPETPDLFDIYLKTSIKIQMSPKDYQQLKTSCEVMLEDRNFLIHQFNQNYSLDTVKNCRLAIDYLDKMREKHLVSIKGLQEIVKTYSELLVMGTSELERLSRDI